MSTRRRRRTTRAARRRRHARLRKRVIGTPQRPRLAVFRSNAHIYCQIIDDEAGHTLVSASDLEPDLRAADGGNKTDHAAAVGSRVAERALATGLRQVVFDRGGYKHHGRIKALAQAARKGGLDF